MYNSYAKYFTVNYFPIEKSCNSNEYRHII